MNELFPIVSGLIVGSSLGAIAPRLRLAVALAAAILLGTAATVVSGEYLIGWEFLLIDIPLVGLSSSASFLLLRHLRTRRSPA